jgi:hypothetical protein
MMLQWWLYQLWLQGVLSSPIFTSKFERISVDANSVKIATLTTFGTRFGHISTSVARWSNPSYSNDSFDFSQSTECSYKNQACMVDRNMWFWNLINSIIAIILSLIAQWNSYYHISYIIYKYDVINDAWLTLPGKMKTPRRWFAFALVPPDYVQCIQANK